MEQQVEIKRPQTTPVVHTAAIFSLSPAMGCDPVPHGNLQGLGCDASYHGSTVTLCPDPSSSPSPEEVHGS